LHRRGDHRLLNIAAAPVLDGREDGRSCVLEPIE
jgi:hypothetical protein